MEVDDLSNGTSCLNSTLQHAWEDSEMVYSSSSSTSWHWSRSPACIGSFFLISWIILEEYSLRKRRRQTSLFVQELKDTDTKELEAQPQVNNDPSIKSLVNKTILEFDVQVFAERNANRMTTARSESPPSIELMHEEVEVTGDGDDEAWSNRVLAFTNAGRNIRNHLAAEDERVRRPCNRESASQSVLCFRRSICHALSKDLTAFGLPRKMPKMIAMLNLSGKRQLVYSQSYCLIRLMCCVSQHATVCMTECLNDIINSASSRNLTLLFTFSLPWQSVDDSCFEIRTLTKQSNGTIVDGELTFCSGWQEVRSAASTVATDSTDQNIIEVQIATLTKCCSAINLDIVSFENVTADNDSDRIRKMQDVTTLLQTERKKLLSDLSTLRAEKQHQLTTITSQYEKRIADLTKSADKAATTATKVIEEIKADNVNLKKQNDELDKVVKLCKQKLAESSLVHDSEQALMARNFSDATAALKEFQKAASKQQAQMEKERDKSEAALSKTIDKLESKVQHETIERRRAEEKVTECDKTCNAQRKELVEVRDAMERAEAANLDAQKRIADLTAKNSELYKTSKANKSTESKRMAEVRKNAEVSVAEATAQVENSWRLTKAAKAEVLASNSKANDLATRLEATEADNKARHEDYERRLDEVECLRTMEQAHLATVEADHKRRLADLQAKHDEFVLELLTKPSASISDLGAKEMVSISINTELFISENETKLEQEIAKRHEESERLKKEVAELKKEVTTTREHHLAVVMNQQKHQQQALPQIPISQMPQQIQMQIQNQMQTQMTSPHQASHHQAQVSTDVLPQRGGAAANTFPLNLSEHVETADDLRATVEGALAKLLVLAKQPAMDPETQRLRVENAVLRDIMRPMSQSPYPQQQAAASFGYFTSVTQ
jgi:hypothetical protein